MRKLTALALVALAGFALSACGSGAKNHNPTFGGATQPPPHPTTGKFGTTPPTTTSSG